LSMLLLSILGRSVVKSVISRIGKLLFVSGAPKSPSSAVCLEVESQRRYPADNYNSRFKR
jgi:hypothetical protein